MNIKEKNVENMDSSVRALFLVSMPLMLSSLSGTLMLLCDRLFLARYSLNSLNSITTISSIILMLQIGINVCASIADVFVGQLNGADRKSELSSPIWQMIWFSFFTAIVFFPLSFYLTDFFPNELRDHQDNIFYSWLLIAICPLSPLSIALSAFFIGRKQTIFPFVSTIIGNTINLILNYLLIFGFDPLNIPEMGIRGAAVATASGQAMSLIFLVLAFFSKKNRLQYHTNYLKFDMSLLLKMLSIGYPNAIAQMMIAGAWTCFFILMNKLGEASITFASIMQLFTGFFVFVIQGISRGIITTSANLIGEKKFFLINRVLFSGVKLSAFLSIVILLLFLFFPSLIIKTIFNADDFEKISVYFENLQYAFFWGWMAFAFKSIRAILSGILISFGKTHQVMWNEVISVWFIFIFPIWLNTQFFSISVSWAYFIAFLYNFTAVSVYSFQFNRINLEREVQLA